jgi:hypothetical protein
MGSILEIMMLIESFKHIVRFVRSSVFDSVFGRSGGKGFCRFWRRAVLVGSYESISAWLSGLRPAAAVEGRITRCEDCASTRNDDRSRAQQQQQI